MYQEKKVVFGGGDVITDYYAHENLANSRRFVFSQLHVKKKEGRLISTLPCDKTGGGNYATLFGLPRTHTGMKSRHPREL